MSTCTGITKSLVILSLLGGLLANGCAGASAARSLSASAASLTDSYKTDTEAFFKAQDAMNQTVAETNALRKQLAAVADNQNRVNRAAWQAANNAQAIRIYDSLSAQSDTTILSSNIDLQSLHPLALPSSTTIDPKQFESVTQTLNQMAQKPSPADQAKFVFNEGKAVSTQYSQSLTEGAKSASKAADQTKPPSKCVSNGCSSTKP